MRIRNENELLVFLRFNDEEWVWTGRERERAWEGEWVGERIRDGMKRRERRAKQWGCKIVNGCLET